MKSSDFMPEPGSETFERCRQEVARRLKWKAENVMNCEVQWYILEQLDHAAATKHFDPIPRASPKRR